MLNDQDSNMAANAICHAASMVHDAAYEQMRPAVLLKPRLFPDGNQWCALLGEDLQIGVAGFGASPAEALYDFDVQMNKKLLS